MTRNHLLKLSVRPRPAAQPTVWRMTMDLLGQAFGVPASRREPRR
ncbi:MAG: hypothetical protein ACK4UQ_12005 [Brevundimonas sp.]